MFSSGMTIARECVSDYELYSKAQVDATEYIEKNTDERAVFLTGDNHNNAVAALTGRSIVCGADTFLCYHGINTVERKSEVANMYADPVGNKELYKKYNAVGNKLTRRLGELFFRLLPAGSVMHQH